MQINEFTESLTTLCNFYERKEPKAATIELWYRLVQRMPSEAIPWIVKKIQETHEAFPKNMTAAFWGSYTEWQQTYPDKKAIKRYFDCPDCTEGLIFASKGKSGVKYDYVFCCAKCRQDHTRAYPVMSRLELSEEYEVQSKAGNLNSSNRNLQNLVKQVGHAISESRGDISNAPF